MIIDTHLHIGGLKIGYDMRADRIIEMMDKYNIDYSIVSSIDAAETYHGRAPLPMEHQKTQEEALRDCLKLANNNPDRIGVAVWVRPYLQEPTEELRQLIIEHRKVIKAIKLHPYHSMLKPTDKKMLPFLELAQEFKLPVVSHTGCDIEDSPKCLYEAAKMFPDIPFVMVHLGLCTDHKEAIRLLGMADNLYGDTTWVPLETTLEVLKLYGNKKLFFGSDSPIDGFDTYLHNRTGELSLYQQYFNELKEMISPEDYNALMYKNAKKIFKC